MRIDCRTYYDLVTAWIICFRREYDVGAHDRIVLDLGANIGCFCCFVVAQNPAARVLAVEPHPFTYRQLENNVRGNGDFDQRIQLWQVGMAETRGKRKMPVGGMPSQSYGLLADDST